MFQRQPNSSPLGRLPYDILEDITDLLSRTDLCSLSLASKECCNLAVRALYSNIPLCSSTDESSEQRQFQSLRRRQFSFFVAISQHPEYTRFIRRISFEFTNREDEQTDFSYPLSTELVWKTFAKCNGVVYIDIRSKYPLHIDIPKASMFPNLHRACITSSFAPQTLAQLLNTSPSIRTLELTGGPGCKNPNRGSSSRGLSIPGPFDYLQNKFPMLQTLSIQIQAGIPLTSLVGFLQRVRMHVTFLILGLPPFSSAPAPAREEENDDWSGWIIEALSGFEILEELWLKGPGYTPDDGLRHALKERHGCLKLKGIKHLESGKCCNSIQS